MQHSGRESIWAGAVFWPPPTPREGRVAPGALPWQNLPMLPAHTMLEHSTTRKTAGVCTDSFNHLSIACTLTVLKHIQPFHFLLHCSRAQNGLC